MSLILKTIEEYKKAIADSYIFSQSKQGESDGNSQGLMEYPKESLGATAGERFYRLFVFHL